VCVSACVWFDFKHQHQQETLTLLTAANRLTTVKSMNKCESKGECVLTSCVTEVRRNSLISSSVPYCCAHATCQSTVQQLLYVAHITDIKSLASTTTCPRIYECTEFESGGHKSGETNSEVLRSRSRVRLWDGSVYCWNKSPDTLYLACDWQQSIS